MGRIFAITAASNHVLTGGDGRGEITFAVTNSSARNLRGHVHVRPLGSTRREWLNIAGDTERAFTPYATQQVVVKVATPLGAPAGKYQFRLDALSTVNPDDEFTEGPTIDLEVKATEAPKKSFPWWIIAMAAGAVILIGAGAWLLWPSGGTKVVFEDNFDEAPKGGWSKTKTETSPNGKAKFLGQFASDSVKLALNDLPSHKTVTVNFDLYINNAWAGDGDERNAPDAWGLKLDDGETLIHTTFSNLSGCSDSKCRTARQTYACKNGEDTSNGCYSKAEDATFGAAAVNSLGYNAFPVLNSKDSLYKIKHTFAHDKSQLILNFYGMLNDRGFEQLGVDKRGWGLDNVRVVVHSMELSEILPKGEGGAKVVFEDNFDEAQKGAWSQTKTETTPNGKTKFLGQFRNDTVKLTLSDLPPHKTATVNFDLYIINFWRGHDTHGPGDTHAWGLFQGEVAPADEIRNGGRVSPRDGILGIKSILLYSTFSNLENRRQAFTCGIGAYASPACYFSREENATYGAAAVNSLGFRKPECLICADSVYKIKRAFAHDKSDLILNFFGELRGQPGSGENQGWGLDNVRVEVQ